MIEQLNVWVYLVGAVVALAMQLGGLLWFLSRQGATVAAELKRIDTRVSTSYQLLRQELETIHSDNASLKIDVEKVSTRLEKSIARSADHSGLLRVLDVRVRHVEESVGHGGGS